MKNVLLIMNIVLLAAVGFLFYKTYASSKSGSASEKKITTLAQQVNNSTCRIAYFEMDSLDNNCDMVKDVKSELSKKEEKNSIELARLDQQYREKANEYQGQSATMTQAQGEAAQQDLIGRQEKFRTRKDELDREYQGLYMNLNTNMKKMIETFLSQYNQNNTYSYIFANESGLFFYKDSAFNITKDVVTGLNEMYRNQKKK
ncbi:MAG: OmpH family outer membrane protein [Chitinophagaceae bacterium]